MDINGRINSAVTAAESGDNTRAARDYEIAFHALMKSSAGMDRADHATAVRSISFNLAQVLNKLGKHKDALNYVNEGLKHTPTSLGLAIAYAAKGEALCGLGRKAEGLQLFSDAAGAHPVVGHINSAESMARLGSDELNSLAEQWISNVETMYGGRINESQRAEIKAIRKQISANKQSPRSTSNGNNTRMSNANGTSSASEGLVSKIKRLVGGRKS